jgi:hypothetical protein
MHSLTATHTNTSLLPHYTLLSDIDGKLWERWGGGVRLADEEYMQLQLNYSLPDANPIPTQVSVLSLHFPS